MLKELSEKLNIEIENITGKLTPSDIIDIQIDPLQKIFFIECDAIAEREQNSILKVLEEPPKNAFICLLTDSLDKLLVTIVNRCIVWKFRPYTKDELREFTDSDLVLKFARTPGQALKYSSYRLEGIEELCNKIFTAIKKAVVPNALSISNKLAWKASEEDKYDPDLFVNCLYNAAHEMCIKDDRYFDAYILTSQLARDFRILHVDKRRLFEGYLSELKMVIERSVVDEA